ncbi:MAG TPA: AAA family ATPase, partial [Solirubrobacteraceae bacterium]|nr:AAA family ATPase [Solirubrobacteraceae bacterium]
MHLRSIALKGFKSFPDRTRLEFGRGVSVIVGPNGSGKSNVTDAVLWAMGEQSPLAVRGQSMQDVIFGGGHGQQARQAAEVEIVIDNASGELPLDFSEISIVRRLDRSGEGEYRLNGARCRLGDVVEVLSDTGLGKEGHSIVSQGRVEAVVTSKPRDRRLLIEEAAGLGKHRKRRRRAQLKLARTQENLDRALDVEREARARLRPLKRQAEAAELHERLERQVDEARWTLAREAVRARRAELADAEEEAARAASARDEAEARLGQVARRREDAEEALARRSDRREALANRVFDLRSARERVTSRLETVRRTETELAGRIERERLEIAALEPPSGPGDGRAAEAGDELAATRARIAVLEEQLAELAADREARLQRELAELEEARAAAGREREGAERRHEARAAALCQGEAGADAAREGRRAAARAADAARRQAAQVGAELAAVNQFLRATAGAPGAARPLAEGLQVEPGYELAVAAALGPRLRAALAGDLAEAGALLDRSGRDGGSVLVARELEAPATTAAATAPPAPGARRLAELVRGEAAGRAASLL